MSRWASQLLQHGFVKSLNTLIERLEPFQLPDNADQNAAMELGRFKKTIAYINTVVTSADPDLLSVHALNEMQGPMQNASNEFNNFFNNKNFTHIQQANNHIDNVLNIISRVFVFYHKPTKTSVASVVDAYQNTISQYLDNVKNKTDQILLSLEKKISAEQSDISKINSEIKAAQDELKNVRNQTQTQITEFSTQFKNAQIAHQGSFDEFVKKQDEKADKEFELLAKKSTTIIAVLEKLKTEAELVFGVVQSTVQAGAHKKYADEEKSTANFHRIGAILLMFSAVAVIILPELKFLISSETHQFDWGKLLERLPISAILFAPAFYLARESTKHRQNEFHNRRQELVLRTVDPYLALIKNETKRDEIKGRIAENIFSDKPAAIDGPDAEGVLAQVSNLIKQLKK